jgi:ribosomal protein S18 acetylase RimI-like enzyme
LGLDDNSSNLINFDDKAFAVYQDNALLLLCVRQAFRHTGIGQNLLKKVEENIFALHEELVLGHSDSHYLYPGVYDENAVDFFKKRGYNFTWDSFDMILDVQSNTWRNASCYDGDDFDFRCKTDSDNAVLKIFGDEIDGWGDYYISAKKCIVAIEKRTREVAGAIIIDENNPYNLSLENTGGFGCVGVRERFRKNGFGMRLCKEALKILSDMKIKKCFIGFTDLVSWYEKLGAKPIAKYAMGCCKLDKNIYL